MACENAIGATDTLRAEVEKAAGADAEQLLSRAVFANTAVDRIVPGQPADGGVNVTVEPYFEWAIEASAFGGSLPNIPGAHFVDDLAPYIERKLFTVNTGHAATAYFGARAGIERISDALADEDIARRVSEALEETSAVLVAAHGLDAAELADYRATILERFRNPALVDTVQRVGRQPLRKISRNERFIGPAAMAAERGLSATALIAAVTAALEFEDADDEQAVEMQELLRSEDSVAFTIRTTGLDQEHPLFPAVHDAVVSRQTALRAS
jgi:mannitol-1-phosphate 5-dehydrogenase